MNTFKIGLNGLLFGGMIITTYGLGWDYPWWIWVIAVLDFLVPYGGKVREDKKEEIEYDGNAKDWN